MEITSCASTRSLHNLYLVRTAFQVAWAALVITTAMRQPMLAAVLFLLYTLWDVACTVYDLKTFSKSGSSRTSQIINALLGVAAPSASASPSSKTRSMRSPSSASGPSAQACCS